MTIPSTDAHRDIGLRSTWLRLEDLSRLRPTGACRNCYEVTPAALCAACDYRRAGLKARFDHFPIPVATNGELEFDAPVSAPAQPVMRRTTAPRERLPYPEDRDE